MRQLRTDNQLWLVGKGSDICATLRRMIMKEGKDTKVSELLNSRPRKRK